MANYGTPNPGDKLRGALCAAFSTDGAADDAFIQVWEATKEVRTIKTAADAMAADATTEYMFFSNSTGGSITITGVTYNPGAALTGSATNNASLVVNKNAAGGTFGSGTAVASLTTTASWVANTVVTVPVVAAAVTLLAGENLSFKITKAMSGVVVPLGVLTVTYVPV